MKTKKLFASILFGIKSSIVIAIIAAFALFSCEKESKSEAGIPSKEKGVLVGEKNPTFSAGNTTSNPFSILYAGVNNSYIYLGLQYQATTEQSKFTVVWDGKYEQKDDSTLINLTVLREANGTVQDYNMCDSLYTGLAQIGITQENLLKAKTVIKIKNGSNPGTVVSFKLENGVGSWYLNAPVVVVPGTETNPPADSTAVVVPGTGTTPRTGTNPPADSTGKKR